MSFLFQSRIPRGSSIRGLRARMFAVKTENRVQNKTGSVSSSLNSRCFLAAEIRARSPRIEDPRGILELSRLLGFVSEFEPAGLLVGVSGAGGPCGGELGGAFECFDRL